MKYKNRENTVQETLILHSREAVLSCIRTFTKTKQRCV